MDFDEYVTEKSENYLKIIRKQYYSDEITCTYEKLLELTIKDIKKIK